MRSLVAVAPAFALLTGIFFACGGSAPTGAFEGGVEDADGATETSGDVFANDAADAEAGVVNCAFMQSAGMGVDDKVDPVAFCVLESVLQNQHQAGFSAKTGTYSSWNYTTLVPDTSGGKPIHDFHDDASYGASCVAYHGWAVLYSSPQYFDADLLALAPLLEAELASLPQEYDGELYFNLRSIANGLNVLGDPDDSAKINAIADKYGRQIFSVFYQNLPLGPVSDAGTADGGTEASTTSEAGTDAGTEAGTGSDASFDAGGLEASADDAGGDPRYAGDGILGTPYSMGSGVLYQPASVASAAYALLDLAERNPSDSNLASWLNAARRSLDHIHNHAREPASGLYYASLVTTGAGADALGPLSTPTNLLSMDVQATVLLYLLRAQQLVVADTTDVDGGTDGGVSGTLKSFTEFPFLPRTSALLSAVQPLWDGSFGADGGVGPTPPGDTGLEGFMDGWVPSSTPQLVSTKSTRANAYMFAVSRLQFIGATGPLGAPPPTLAEGAEGSALRTLLSNETFETNAEVVNNTPHESFYSVVGSQQAYFNTISPKFQLLTSAEAGVNLPQSYTAAAIAAVVQGFDTQLVGFTP